MTEPAETPFVRMATGFIDQANAFSREAGQDVVATALMHAAARYGAFATAANAERAADFAAERDEAIEHFTAQFRDVVTQHYDDYVSNFKAYLGRD